MNFRITRSFPEPHTREEIEAFAEKSGVSVFYTLFDNFPLAVLSDKDIKTGDTITALVNKQVYNRIESVWEARIFRAVDPYATQGQMFGVYEIC